MANLTTAQLAGVAQQAMRRFSNIRKEIPVNKSQFMAFMSAVDIELEASEIAIVQGLPAGPGKDWLLANPDVGRELIVMIELERSEVL
jgi:RecA-family ATPase